MMNDHSIEQTSRRGFLELAATVAGTAVVASALPLSSAAAATTEGAEAAFLAAFAGPFDSAKQLAFLSDNALAVVHDVPYPLDKAGFANHLAFHADQWETRALMPESVLTRTHGKTAIVSCYFNERGKPRDSGFRQRPGFLTATCVHDGRGWRALSVHTSALRSQILDASPG
jgi:hypothetical protein